MIKLPVQRYFENKFEETNVYFQIYIFQETLYSSEIKNRLSTYSHLEMIASYIFLTFTFIQERRFYLFEFRGTCLDNLFRRIEI